jgi:hypothetical protein
VGVFVGVLVTIATTTLRGNFVGVRVGSGPEAEAVPQAVAASINTSQTSNCLKKRAPDSIL